MLRVLKDKDIPFMLEWMHDPEINQWFQVDFAKFSEENVRAFIEEANRCNRIKKDYHYAIIESDGEYLGTISLKNIDLINRNAEYAICMRKKAIGKGLAFNATQELLQIAFFELQLNRIYLNVLSENKRAIRLYEKCGFRYEGEWINHLYKEGKFHSIKWYGLQKEEWIKGC